MPRTETLTYLALALAGIALLVALYALKLAHDLKEMGSQFNLDKIAADVHRIVVDYTSGMNMNIDKEAVVEGAKKAALAGAEQLEDRDPRLAGMLRKVAGDPSPAPGDPSPGPFGRQAGWMAPY